MAKDEAKVLGDERFFKISPQIKKYALRDTGFVKTNRGSFQLDRPLSGDSPYAVGNKLKITIGAELDTLKMSVTDPSGMKAVNIFKDEKTANVVEQFNYQIENLMERDILIVAPE